MGVVVIVGTEKGAFVARSDDKRSWSVGGPLFKGWKATCAARGPDGRFWMGTASRVYGAALQVSEDLKEWRQVENGPAYPEGGKRTLNQVWTIVPAGERLYAGVDEAGLFQSDDGGESWQPVDSLNEHASRDAWFPGAGGLCAHVVLPQGDRLWVGISAVGAWRSDDQGATWQARNSGVRQVIEDESFKDIGFCIHGLAPDPDERDTLYRQDHTGMYKTTDAGDTWERAMEGLPSWFGFPVVFEPRTRSVLCFPMESDEYRMPVEGRFRVYRSRDRAASWEELAEGLPAQPTYAGVLRGAMAVDGEGGVYVGSTGGAVYASADAGDTWRPLPCTLPRVLSVEAFAG